jgi:hypothetical protein
MTDLLASVLLVAANSPGPRGDNPDDGGGVLIIVAIVLAVLLAGLLLGFLFRRFGRARPEAMTHTPSPEGRVGRVSEFQDN